MCIKLSNEHSAKCDSRTDLNYIFNLQDPAYNQFIFSTGLSKINMNAVKKAVDGDLFQLTIRGKDNYETLMSIRDALELAARVPQAIKEEHQGTKAAEDLCPFIGN